MMKYLAIGFLFLVFSMVSTGCGESKSGAVAVSDELSVVTFNLWHGLNPTGAFKFDEYDKPGEKDARLNLFLEQARAVDPDILFLQEVNPVPGMSKRIARELGYDVVFIADNAGMKIGPVGLPVNLRSGLAILAKKGLQLKGLGGKKLSGPFGSCGRFFSFQFLEFRYVQAAIVIFKNQKILLLNTHLHHGLEVTEEFRGIIDQLIKDGKITQGEAQEAIKTGQGASERRRGELSTALKFAQRFDLQNLPVLFAGDFNASPNAPELVWLRQQNGFYSVTRDDDPQNLIYTWDPKSNSHTLLAADFTPANAFEEFIKKHFSKQVVDDRRHLDYIFIKDGSVKFEVVDSGLFGDKPKAERMASDHFGIRAILKFR